MLTNKKLISYKLKIEVFNEIKSLKFRCSKKIANAVVRNKIKRRIRHIMRINSIKGMIFYIKLVEKDKPNLILDLSFNKLKFIIENAIKYKEVNLEI